MKIDFIGIGGAFNIELGSNCAYIKEENKILFIDFGLDTFEKVLKHNLLKGIEEIYVLITHTHGDHIGGLFTFIQYASIILKIKVKIVNNSEKFTNDLKTLFNITDVIKIYYEFVNIENLPFSFDVCLRLTKHSPAMECYSIIFTKDNKKTLYTSDSNDLDFLKEKIADPEYETIYTEVGDNSYVHMPFSELLKLDKEKLVLMHIQSQELLKRVLEVGFKIPDYLK